jgi:hypothetical protein
MVLVPREVGPARSGRLVAAMMSVLGCQRSWSVFLLRVRASLRTGDQMDG